MEKWLMIVNPASASASTAETWVESKRILLAGGLDVEHVLTQHPGHAIDLAREGAEKGFRRFIAVGGDGTIHEVMTGLLRYADAAHSLLSDFTLGVLPYGTGNDWIRTSLVPKDMNEAAACIVRGKTAPEDVVRLTMDSGVFCMANIGGVGIDADICHHTNNLKANGHKGGILYKLVAPYSVLSKKCGDVEIVCDGQTVYSGPLYSAVIANGIYRGGGLRQNVEDVRWDDGLVDVSIMPGMSRFKGLGVMMHALSGDFAVQPSIISRRFRTMTLKPLGGTPDRVESDGEVPGVLPLTVEATGQQINIIVP